MTRLSRLKAEERAAELLQEHGLLDRVPVPVQELAVAQGVIVRFQPFDADDVSGLLLREDQGQAIIGVNSANASVRQTFTIAHELGHYVLHKGRTLILDRHVRVNFRDAMSSTASDEEEMQANAFAAALLMPQVSLRSRLDRLTQGKRRGDGEIVDRLASEYRVSRAAMEFRLINLGILTPR
jgi:Zn-dependent peptidase ImmA (M78 family)